jgi:hypothetical protein
MSIGTNHTNNALSPPPPPPPPYTSSSHDPLDPFPYHGSDRSCVHSRTPQMSNTWLQYNRVHSIISSNSIALPTNTPSTPIPVVQLGEESQRPSRVHVIRPSRLPTCLIRPVMCARHLSSIWGESVVATGATPIVTVACFRWRKLSSNWRGTGMESVVVAVDRLHLATAEPAIPAGQNLGWSQVQTSS